MQNGHSGYFSEKQVVAVAIQLTLFRQIIMIQMAERIQGQTGEGHCEKPYKVLSTVNERYQIMNIQLESGTFEKMFVCWDDNLKEILTARVVSKSAILEDSKQNTQKERSKDFHAYALRNEIALLEKLSHENIPKLQGCFETPQSLYLFFEYCPRGSIHSIVSKQGPLEYEHVMPLWRQLLRVTCYLHRSGFVHRDIQPRNIYVNEKGRLKLINFKSAYNLQEYSAFQEMLLEKTAFMAPEVFAGQPVTAKIDVWSLGVTLFYMLCGCSPWPHVKETDWHRRLGSSIVFPEDIEIQPKLKRSIEKMLIYDPKMRVSVKELAHQFAV